MARLVTATAGFLLCSTLALAQQQQPRGVPARQRPADYTAHLSISGVTYAASLVSADEVKHVFAFDISKNYVVFEVALYPQPDAPASLDPDGFVARPAQTSDPVHSADPATVASVIQQKNIPRPPSRTSPVTVSTAAEVGHESGTDPVTGQRVHGTYTATHVGVATGGDGGPPPMPSPGGYPQDRELLENQLWEKSLPGGKMNHPTAGYLYFPSSALKKKAGGGYELEYLSSAQEPVLNGSTSTEKIQLRIPAKSR